MVGGLSWKTDCTRMLDTHSHIPRQSFPVWLNLYWPQVMGGPFMHHQIWCTDDMHRKFRCSGFLSLLWGWKHRQTLTAEDGKILFVENLVGEKRRERLYIGEFRGTQKQVMPWVRWGVGFIAYFCIAWGWKCISDANRCFLGRRSVFLTTAVCPLLVNLLFRRQSRKLRKSFLKFWIIFIVFIHKRERLIRFHISKSRICKKILRNMSKFWLQAC
jgi:hypothetical protein